MYLAPAADTPSTLSWWQRFILGWYLPASFALIWLSGPLWRGKKSTNEWLYAVSNRQISISGRYDLLHQLFFAGLFIYLGYLLLHRPQKHALLFSLTVASLIGGYLAHKALIGSPLRVGMIIWELDFDELGAYNVRFGYVLASSVVSCSVVAFQSYLYPALASNWLNVTLTWFRVLITLIAFYSIYAGSYYV
ncbi:MAG TPA: hypothetical protein DEF47_17870 [Herpetosiphon sp.]|uniref:Uncharacterized protein n=1 Tax=Herpetosiphon aurantiacus (strain ATCC 23779 / DSM 785 / 114-95) TaxID=316274 RepID=A9AYC8_HERA2|nr:hypothetical protein [Herpetosiphon sp.]ABX03510.1 hypothetical protein Haur_0862 [Herpetosiphon aurantiacus DSM 785]HBW51764.1 hypothetical protein [Herpetosiphon sp.]